MHQRNHHSETTTKLISAARLNDNQNSENIGARLVTFYSAPSKSPQNIIQHRYVPYPLNEKYLIFETITFVFKIAALFLQYLLIYKSEKWSGLHYTPTDRWIHWHHIDQYIFLLLILFCLSLREKYFALEFLINVIVIIYTYWKYSWKYTIAFMYPFICSLYIYFQNLCQTSQQRTSLSTNILPAHWCSPDSYNLRHETDCLRNEFNQRLRYILFTSFLSSYYTCVVPAIFCDTNYIHLDISLLLKFSLVVFLSLIMIYTSRYLPLELLTVFHRNGEHLGSWDCMTTISNHLPMIPLWDEKHSVAYEANLTVKYKNAIYRSSNSCSNVAEPGNVYHKRYGKLFSRPFVFPLILCSLQTVLITIQIVYLLYDQRWFVLLSQIILFILNTYTMHHTARDIYLLYLVHYRG